MNPKEQYEEAFASKFRQNYNEDTKKISSYFSDLYFLLYDPTTGKPDRIGQAVNVMERLVIEENGNL